MKSRLLKGSLIGVGALVLSTLGLFAADSLQGIDGGIGNLASLQGGGMCPQGMDAFKGPDGVICVDRYESSAAESCPNRNPRNVMESEKNASTKGCYAASVEKASPWTFITLTQAQRVCAESGKRLPTSDEWYALALGTDETSCFVKGDAPRQTGSDLCISSAGAQDMIGNVWEWVNETVQGVQFSDRTLPQEGYVSEADASGIAIATDPDTGSELYGSDYFWSKSDGTFGMIRGGFYGSGSDAGLYTVNASVPPNFATQGVGFRCVSDVL
jgi:formylglycine-generating enzyme required for sulfatase activity